MRDQLEALREEKGLPARPQEDPASELEADEGEMAQLEEAKAGIEAQIREQ